MGSACRQQTRSPVSAGPASTTGSSDEMTSPGSWAPSSSNPRVRSHASNAPQTPSIACTTQAGGGSDDWRGWERALSYASGMSGESMVEGHQKRKDDWHQGLKMPCVGLGYCPYGPLVENFPMSDDVLTGCRVFGHECPVFTMAEKV